MAGVLFFVLQLIGWLILLAAIAYAALWLVCWVYDMHYRRQRARRLEIERVLDQKQLELRRSVLRLAEALVEERLQANQASADMIRAVYISRGQLP